jgi:ABC-type multidrug transport system fused ATPase/permease subunit
MSSNTTEPSIGTTSIFHNLPSANAHPGYYLAVYSLIVLGDAILGSLASGVGSWGSYRAAVTIHDRLLGTVLKSTVRFFDTTPLGRIINRFSKDIETIDGSLNSSLMTVIVYVANLFVAVAVVATIVPWFLVPAAIISYLYYQYTLLYLRAGRSVRRLEATLRSPIYSGFSEVLDGVVSVRAFGAEERFFKTLCDQVDKTQSAFYYYWMMNRWLLLRFDFLGALSVFFTTLFALSGAVKPGSAGMAVLSAQSFVSACYWVSRFWGQLEMDFNAVERVEEYLHLPQEPPSTTSNAPPAYWPSSSSGTAFLRVEELEIKYAPDLPTVFKGSFTIAAGEKIGLIGRTGSGKSTLAMSMLRFSEPAGGKIVLDGIDITSIGVDDLVSSYALDLLAKADQQRSRITYIPQGMFMTRGTNFADD